MKNNIPFISTTMDHGQFKIIDVNREIDRTHLNKLIRGIESKNLLHLFPIIVNQKMQVIEGQHRLMAAKHLKVPIFYIIDNDITAADIAMVNSNRKTWAAKDYVLYYAKSGDKVFKNLHQLRTEWPKCTFMAASRLMDANCMAYYSGGAQFSRGIKNGKLNGDNYPLARLICQLAKQLEGKYYEYAFNAYFLCDVKNAIIQSGMDPEDASATILKKCVQLPKVTSEKYPNLLSKLKDILNVKSIRPHASAESVAAFLEKHKTKHLN